MKISNLLSCIGDYKLINKIKNDSLINNIELDSRKISDGDLFICLKGNNNDGHNYIKDVTNKK